MDFVFFANSILLGVGLAMDAFSVSMANGLNEPGMKRGRMWKIAGTYGFFQFIMPLIGWFLVRTVVDYFDKFRIFIPWIALLLLCFIGIKMIYEAFHPQLDEESNKKPLTNWVLILQGIATSIDALSVGFTIVDYSGFSAFICALIIAVVTLFICMGGLVIGKRFGLKLESKAQILGGLILIGIGIEIFVKGII